MNEEEKYLFDLNGYVVLSNVLSAQEIEHGNEAIDHHSDQMWERDSSLAGESTSLKGSSRRAEVGGMLSWKRPWCELFRSLLIHPGTKPYLEGILGEGYRLDHGPGLITMVEGCEGGQLHGGGVERPNFSEAYFFKDGRIYTGLTVVEYLFADEGPGDGGVAIVPGSHKSNLPCPEAMRFWDKHQEHVVEVNGHAGDAIIFTETLTHGTLPWTAKHQRRALLYKFSPSFQAYSGGAHTVTYPDYIEDMTEEQRMVMKAPQVGKPN